MHIDINNKAASRARHIDARCCYKPECNYQELATIKPANIGKRGSADGTDNKGQFRHNVRKITYDCDDSMPPVQRSH